MTRTEFEQVALNFEEHAGKAVEFKYHVPGKGYKKDKGTMCGIGVFDNAIVRIRKADNRCVAVPYSNVHIPVNH